MLSLLALLAIPLFPQKRLPVIAIGGIRHESNSFNPAKTQLADFAIRKVTAIDEALAEWAKSNDEISGYIEGARRLGLELYPTLIAEASPKGPVTDEAFNTLVNALIQRLKTAPRLDGLLLP